MKYPALCLETLMTEVSLKMRERIQLQISDLLGDRKVSAVFGIVQSRVKVFAEICSVCKYSWLVVSARQSWGRLLGSHVIFIFSF